MITTEKINWHPKNRKAYYLKELISTDWDIVIIGGGIIGAGVLHNASYHGFKTLLIEQRDFAWGTSCRSSKMIHGGLRYLAQGNFKLTKESVHEREYLLKNMPGLVESFAYIMPHYKAKWPPKSLFKILLNIYDLFSGKRQHSSISKDDLLKIVPGIDPHQLKGGTHFYDAKTNDSRLVFRLLQEARSMNGHALNYCEALKINRSGRRNFFLSAMDILTKQKVTFRSRSIINCTGVWAEKFGKNMGSSKRIRPLRGSHICVSGNRLPLSYTISMIHPQDKRLLFAFPWEDHTVIGTTDLDHKKNLKEEPAIDKKEVDYLLKAANDHFPEAKLKKEDIISSWSGIRPIVSKNKMLKPSSESRDHFIWKSNGIVSVAGSKLTTFAISSYEVLKHSITELNGTAASIKKIKKHIPYSKWDIHNWPSSWEKILGISQLKRLSGLYGGLAESFIKETKKSDLRQIQDTNYFWGEIIWSLKKEAVIHLDDLMLRRTHLGLILPKGGEEILNRIGKLYCRYLHCSSDQFKKEVNRYKDIWNKYYSVP